MRTVGPAYHLEENTNVNVQWEEPVNTVNVRIFVFSLVVERIGEHNFDKIETFGL